MMMGYNLKSYVFLLQPHYLRFHNSRLGMEIPNEKDTSHAWVYNERFLNWRNLNDKALKENLTVCNHNLGIDIHH